MTGSAYEEAWLEGATPWKKRGPLPLDDGFLVTTWLTSYVRTREGVAAGAAPRTPERDLFFATHKPVVELLLSAADVEVLCDPEDPTVIWAWACTSGDVVHQCIVKREAAEALGPEDTAAMVRDLLGDRLDRACAYTYFLSDLHHRRLLPKSWFPASVWLATNHGRELARKKAA